MGLPRPTGRSNSEMLRNRRRPRCTAVHVPQQGSGWCAKNGLTFSRIVRMSGWSRVGREIGAL
ncbi:hypothetical protein SCLCIDRAFT_404339 [Scleroderma citrinum Foug A]|uniref:Uncharacterized protein n=1 Tax=Scleroderma citrinum Foug A TaxID=1036808 RepID=A0A0C2ZMV8_9AGAM|nr:hypothetical protein SCLCIDRAFT_404339 [Scleroderma citrinum Foug A]